MKQGAVAVRYAKALFTLALEKKVLEKVYGDVQNISEVVKQHNDFTTFIESPVVKISEKQQLFQAVFKNKVEPIVSSFLDLVVSKNRQEYLLAMCSAFVQQYKNQKGHKEVKITTAVLLTEKVKKEISELIARKLNAEIDLETLVNPKIIGGFMLRIDDMLLDKSIATKLDDIRKQLLSK